MPENPLLPHRKLKELYALMLLCRELDKRQRRKAKSPAREALLAATSIHLLPGDLLLGEASDSVARQLAPKPRKTALSAARFKPAPPTPPDASLPLLTLAAAAAHGLKAAPTDALVLTFTREGALEPGWAATLEWAHRNGLPLLVACAASYSQPAATKAKTNPDSFTWDAVHRVATRLKMPVLTVDGEDAVAVYRVMQESSLRARLGGGPAIIWAMLTPASAKPLPRSQQPVARLQAYLKARAIPLPQSR